MTKHKLVNEIFYHIKNGKSYEDLLGIYTDVPSLILKMCYNSAKLK
jgi:hypothetical protein